MNPQEFVDYQNSQLAELDKQMAVWDQRLQVLDQQLATANQSLQDSVVQLRSHLNSLVAAADEWLQQASVDPSTPSVLVAKVESLKAQVIQLGQISVSSDPASLQTFATALQALSEELLANLTQQANTFSASLNQASSDLATHYGIQI